ncbi:MAG: acetamidase/formamidase family protein [Stutzerimonas stutzeri]
MGDTHAAQGDGEVCGTAIESRMNVVVTLDLIKDARSSTTPRFTTPGTGHQAPRRHGLRSLSTGIGPDLMTGGQGGAVSSRWSTCCSAALPHGCRSNRPICWCRCAATCAFQRDRRPAQLGRVVLRAEGGVRLTATPFLAGASLLVKGAGVPRSCQNIYREPP